MDLYTDTAVLPHLLAQRFCFRRGKGSHPKGRYGTVKAAGISVASAACLYFYMSVFKPLK